jgi:hypothetical protein
MLNLAISIIDGNQLSFTLAAQVANIKYFPFWPTRETLLPGVIRGAAIVD